MNASFTALIVALATPVVAFLIYLFNRRATLRGLNTTSDSTLVVAGSVLVEQLQNQIGILNDRILVIEAGRAGDLAELTAQLGRAHAENARCASAVATLRTDLDIAERQIGELKRHLNREGQS